jgi:hypothetical protein
VWSITASNFITYGNPITISVNQNSLEDGYFGTINYEITGTNVTSQTLGRATTGKVVFSGPGPETETVTWTIPANSNISEFTFTLTTLDGTESTGPGETDPALYWGFSNNGLPTGYFVNVTNNGISNNDASHIHLVAGDPVTTDIYLGDDDQYVKIEKNGGDVVVGTNANTNHWRFGTDGTLTLPSGNTRIGNALGTDGIIGSTGTGVAVVAQGNSGYAGIQWTPDIESIGSSTQAAALIVNSPIGSTTGTVQILTGIVTSQTAENVWEFGPDSNLTIPNDIKDANGSVIRVASTSTAPTRVNGQLWFNNTEGRLYIRDNGLWIDASPTIVPPPSTYLGDIEIDGSTLYINSSTLTINNSGTLLVNGTEVTAPTVNTYLQNLFYN